MLERTALFAGTIAALVACGSSAQPGGGFNGSGGSGGGGNGGFGGSGSGGGSLIGDDGGTVPGGPGCSDAAKLVYVVTIEGDLWSFDPKNVTFSKVGPLSCSPGSQPNSMAIDRTAQAYVNYEDGQIFKVSTKDATCQKTGWQPRTQFSPFSTLVMAFSTSGQGSTDDTLFAEDDYGMGFGTIQIPSFSLNQTMPGLGGDLAGQPVELTGTGDGRLYAFAAMVPSVSEIDKKTGNVLKTFNLSTSTDATSFTFAFWGGSFYIFTSPCMPPSCPGIFSTITKLDLSTGQSSVVNYTPPDSSAFNVDGSGVSTCAPTQPVQ